MKSGADEQRKKLAAGVLGVLAVGLVGYQLYDNVFAGGTPVPLPAVPVKNTASGPVAPKVASGQLSPTLRMEPMLVSEALIYSGSGRDIFAPGSPELPSETQGPSAAGRTDDGTKPTVVVTEEVKPSLPSIPLKYFGTATSANGTSRAFLLAQNGDDVFLASVGDIVQRRYRLVSIAAGAVLIDDIPNSSQQTLSKEPIK